MILQVVSDGRIEVGPVLTGHGLKVFRLRRLFFPYSPFPGDLQKTVVECAAEPMNGWGPASLRVRS